MKNDNTHLFKEIQLSVKKAELEGKEMERNGELILAFLFGALLNLSASIVYSRWISGNDSLEIAVLAGTIGAIVPIFIYFFKARKRLSSNAKRAKKLLNEYKKEFGI